MDWRDGGRGEREAGREGEDRRKLMEGEEGGRDMHTSALLVRRVRVLREQNRNLVGFVLFLVRSADVVEFRV